MRGTVRKLTLSENDPPNDAGEAERVRQGLDVRLDAGLLVEVKVLAVR